jgi:surface polysaccharide O-acyltransferase-like enzyme
MNKRSLILFLLSLTSFFASAQDNGPQMADGMRADGKIYVVIGVLSIVFISLIVFLILQERKIARLEKQIKK